ncbi:MAG: putative quinol monooxygenase [Candidatus Dormibacteria bacterium]
MITLSIRHMIIIYATMDSKEPVSDEAMRTCVDFQNGSLTEPGCLGYLFTRDFETPERLHVLERWESEKDLQTHMGSPRSAEFAKWMNERAASVKVNRFVAEDQSDDFRRHSAELMGDSVQT